MFARAEASGNRTRQSSVAGKRSCGLCPVSLDDAWKDKVTDVLWEHLEKNYILDFSKWKTKAFGGQFDKLLKGLKIYYEKPKE